MPSTASNAVNIPSARAPANDPCRLCGGMASVLCDALPVDVHVAAEVEQGALGPARIPLL